MKFSKAKFILSAAFFFFFLVLLKTNIFASISLEAVSAGYTKAPQNSTKVNVLSFKVIAVGDTDYLKTVNIKNNSVSANFGTGIKTIYLYKDTNNDGAFNADQDTLLTDKSFTSSSTKTQALIISAGTSLATDASTGFFILYDINTSAPVGSTTNIEIQSLQNSNGNAATVSTNVTSQTNEITITGLQTQTAEDISPKIVIPGEENIKMLKIILKPIGEDLGKNDISLTIKNEENNFANVAGSTSGVTKVDLYKDIDSDGELSATDTLLKSISGTSFTSTSEAVFSSFSNPDLTFTQGVTTNLFVVYTMGADSPVSKDSKIKAQLTAFSGTGSDSLLAMTLSAATPILAATASVAGISYSNLESIVPSANRFGPGTTAPILKFELTAQNLAVTINKITVQNNGSVKYITNSSKTDGVTKIRIYEDTNNDSNYSGEPDDTLIGDLALGYGAGQTAKSAPIPISFSSPNIGLYIATDDVKTIFVTYDFGTGISTATDASGNATSKVDCELEDAAGSSNASIYDIELSGALPVSSDPVAEVSVESINLRVVSVENISPTFAVRGQEKVPMLYLKLTADANISSATVQVLNNKNTFLDNSTGVTKIWIYQDKNQNQIYDSPDVFLSAVSTFNEPLRTYFPQFNLSQGENHLLILYDIGFAASLTAENIACQLENIVSSGDATPILLGADLPLPKNPSLLTIKNNLLSINKITCSTANINNNSGSFNVEIEVANSSTQNVKIKTLSPRLYFNAKSGTDISYEFNMGCATNFPVTLNAGTTQNFTFSVKASELSSAGTAYIDGNLSYQISSGNYAFIHRYKTSSSEWALSVASPPQIEMSTTRDAYAWQGPSYIASVNIEVAGQKSVFQNYDSVPAHSVLYIYFKDKAQYLDEASLEVVISNSATANKKISISNLKTQSTSVYEFNREEGYLKILDLGTSDGEININLTDSNGNTLSSLNLNFYIASTIEIHEAFFYPNPYFTSKSNLLLGFRLTQAADITVYLFNMLGELVWKYDTSYTSLGYKEINWNAQIDGKLIGAGIYIAKIVAIDSAGNKAYAISRLAVY